MFLILSFSLHFSDFIVYNTYFLHSLNYFEQQQSDACHTGTSCTGHTFSVCSLSSALSAAMNTDYRILPVVIAGAGSLQTFGNASTVCGRVVHQ